MKKVFVLLFVMVCSLFTTVLATDFVRVSSDMTKDWYVDIDSVNVIRYAPPLYTIDAVAKIVNLEKGSIVLYRFRFFYDINSKEMKLSMMERSRDDGNTWDYISNRTADYLPKGSHGYNMGEAAFYKAYRMWFSSI